MSKKKDVASKSDWPHSKHRRETFAILRVVSLSLDRVKGCRLFAVQQLLGGKISHRRGEGGAGENREGFERPLKFQDFDDLGGSSEIRRRP